MTDLHTEMILEEYKDNVETFKEIQKFVTSKLKVIIEKDLGLFVNSIDTRIKTEKSLKGKLDLKGFKYKNLADITDIFGARIVSFYMDEVDKIASAIEKVFEINWDKSVDKRKIYKVDQFGYKSLHYICRIPETLYKDEKYPNLNNFYFEIQIRTNLQHTWATIYHDTGYKNDIEVPTKYLRQLNRLAGLLELADEEFLDIRNSIEQYRKNIKNIVKSGNFDDVELNADSFKAYIENGGFSDLNKRIAAINNMDIEQTPLDRFLGIFKNIFGFKTLKDLHDFYTNNEEDAYQLELRRFQGKDIDIISSSVGMIALCSVAIVKEGYNEKGLIYLLDTMYGPKKTNEHLSKTIYENCKQMGLVKENG